jgi:hypothetical protein
VLLAVFTPPAFLARGSLAECDLFASPVGSDVVGDGSVGRPFASVGRLDAALAPGQTGCLRAGTYGDTGTWQKIDSDGTPAARIVISSYPGERATIVGWVDIEASATTVENVAIDGSNTFYDTQRSGTSCPYPVSQPLVIGGSDDILQYVDYYQSVASLRGNGIGVGFWGTTNNTIIRYDKIHDVGQCMAFDHLIYLSHGNNAQIYGNWMYNDPHGDGVQLYPDPTNARVFDNVIDNVGEGLVIGNAPGEQATGNQIYDNAITNTTGLTADNLTGDAIHDIWAGTPGTGNTFHNNLLYNNPGGLGQLTNVQSYANQTANPAYTNPTTHNYQPQPNSPAATLNLWNGQTPS